MRKHFHNVMLDLTKQDAFAMEVSAYHKPWLTKPSAVINAFRTFTDQMAGFWGEQSFFAFVNYVDANLPVLFCHRNNLGPIEEDYSAKDITPPNLISWLYDRLEKLRRASRLNQHQLLIAPYVVQKSGPIEQMLKTGKSTYEMFRDIGPDLDGFLYTRAELFPSAVPYFKDAYYSSALVASVDMASLPEEEAGSRLRALCNRAEALSIKFQMSWGYPQLLKDREDASKREAATQERLRALEQMGPATEAAKRLTEALAPVFRIASNLNRMLKPLPNSLLINYQRMTPYLPPNDGLMFFKRWNFRHTWREKLANAQDRKEAFRSQLACIVLAYLGSDIPVPGDGVEWKMDPPWLMLSDKSADALERLHPKISKTILKIHDPECEWLDSDIDSFLFLKACFYTPFKTKVQEPGRVPSKLTGPLFALWIVENEGHLEGDIREILFSEKAQGGDGWPDLTILPALHGLVLELSPKNDNGKHLSAVNVSTSEVRVTIPIGNENHIEPITAAVDNFSKSKRPKGEMLGSLHDYVNAVLWAKGTVTSSTSERILEISFTV